MNERVKHLSLEARKLPVAERAELIDDLLASLEAPDARLDALWAQEAERRVQLLDSGEMPTRDAAEAIADLRRARGS
jgi:Putative addiction module component